jgi:uncharacterized phage protein (TIGR01671 family)
MKRELKFRAWDGERLRNVSSVGWIDGEMDYIGTPKYHGPAEDFKLMQYTGLKDSQSVEIYEGDIVQRNNNPKDLAQVCFGEFPVYEMESEEVIDKAVGWYLKVIPTDALSKMEPFCYDSIISNYWNKNTNAKVIGNIYENPELMEEPK